MRTAAGRGVTLIELLVGLAIGLMATVVIAQVIIASEERRRTTAAGSDAQVAGALALYAVQREVQGAGYGLTTSIAGLGCEVRAQRAGTNYTFTLAPIQIADGAGGLPDRVLVMSSAKLSFSLPARIRVNHPQQSAVFFVNSTVGIEEGDVMVAVPGVIDAANWCSVFNVTNLGGNDQIVHNQNQGQGQGQGTPGPWNQAGGSTIFPNAGYPANGSYVINLGQFETREFGVNAAGALAMVSFSTATAVTSNDELFPDIANLQALYGKDTDGNGSVDTYDSATPTTAAGWAQVLALRLAIVARSPRMEKEPVTAAQPLWDVGNAATVAGSAACGTSMCLTLKIDHLPDWQRYRYKVYDSVVPLRNQLWRS
jgi:type IV pilus assembly protein PilW